MRSAIRFLDAQGRPLDGLADTRTTATSHGLDWHGVYVEAGHNEHWEADELRPDAHYIALNVAPTPLAWEAKIDGRFQRVSNAPGAFWFCPAGESFSHRVAMASDFVLVKIEPARFAAWTGGRPVALARRYGIESPQIDHLGRALAEEARRGGPNGALFVDALASAITLAVAGSLGAAPAAAPGALAPARLQRVLDYIEAHLAAKIGVDDLAAVATYSAAHFARAFKAAMGVAPHQYLLERRLHRAREAIRRGLPAAQAAADLGFADQSHFTKAYKSAFGTTPARDARAA